MPASDVIDVWQVHTGPSREDARVALREILGSYVGPAAARRGFTLGPHGKPALPGRDLEFSFSRSGEFAFVAVSSGMPVGIDVQQVKPGRAVERIARRRFAQDEAAVLTAAEPVERDAAFHRCWTAKEAYVKGLGTGLSLGLARFSVAALVAGKERCAVGKWEVARLDAPRGYAAAVAAPGSGWRVDRMGIPHG